MNKLVLLALLGLILAVSQDFGEAKRSRCSKANYDDGDDEDYDPWPEPPQVGLHSIKEPALPECREGAIRILLTQELNNRQGKVKRDYYGWVRIDSAQHARMRFDTTARDLWLPDDAYFASESITGQRISGKKIYLDDRSLEGTAYKEDFMFLEDVFKDNYTSPYVRTISFRHPFLSASQGFVKGEMGAIGLSSKRLNDLRGPTYLGARKAAGLSTRFGLYLNPTKDAQHGGEIVIGCVNEKRYDKGTLKYHPLVETSDVDKLGWKVHLNEVKVGDNTLSVGQDKFAALDTGREEIRAPKEAVDKIRNQLGARQSGDAWTVDCDKRSEKLSFKIDNEEYKIDGNSFLIENAGRCQLNIEPWTEEGWALGTSFLSSLYTIFELNGKQVGFAKPS